MKTFELASNLTAKRGQWQIDQSNRELGTRTFLFPRHWDVHCIKGFIEYACFCYQNHYGIVISPTDIMYMVQAELASVVKSYPETFAPLFTTTPGTKQEIITFTGNVEEIDVFAVVDQLRERVPTNVDLFLPEFSTTSIAANLATHVAFCDMVSPYYNYSTCLCGIPTVEVAGTIEDWQKLSKTLFDLSAMFSGDLKKYLGRVWARVASIIKECSTGNGALFTQMVSMKKCGSGSQYEITGWILDFMNTPDKPPIMLQNVHQHISKMEYKNLETQRTFEMYAGIFYCELFNTIAKPVYNANRIETTGTDNKKDTREQSAWRKTAKLPSGGLNLELTSEPIVASTRKLKLPEGFKIELGQDIQSFHSIDAEDALLGVLATAMNLAEIKAKKKKS